jgi:hypothetical protein
MVCPLEVGIHDDTSTRAQEEERVVCLFDSSLDIGSGGFEIRIAVVVKNNSLVKIQRLIPNTLPLDGLIFGVGGFVEPNDVFLDRQMLFNLPIGL